MLEKVQKAFLRYLYKRVYGYYPFLYPSLFLLGTLGFNSLRVRRARDQMVISLKILHGHINASDLLEKLCRLFVPENYCRVGTRRRHQLLAVERARTVARAQSPLCRMQSALNLFLDDNPDRDLFASRWRDLMKECLMFCEKMYECKSTIL